MNSNIVLVTTTFYHDINELRYQLFLKTVDEAKRYGYPVIVVDGSPEEMTTGKIQELGITVHRELVRGMGSARRFAFFSAREFAREQNVNNKNIYVWLEPEKYDFIRSVSQIIQPIIDNVADIVIPKRSQSSWETYPEFQVISEREINRVYHEITGLSEFDSSFGPVACNEGVLPYFINTDGRNFGIADTYVNVYAPFIAHLRGLRLSSVIVDFIYPPEQKKEEEEIMREVMVEKRSAQFKMATEAFRIISKQLKGD